MSGHGRGWQEVGDRVFRFRYRSLDLNVGAVLGADEVLVADTRSFAAGAAELLADLRPLTPLPCRQLAAMAALCRRLRRSSTAWALSARAAWPAGAAAPGTARRA